MSSFSNDNQKLLKAAGIGILATAITAALLSCVFALVLLMTSGIPYGILDYAMIGIAGFSVFIGAYIASSVAKSKGLIIGVICGATTLLVLLVVGLSVPGGNIGVLTLIRATVTLVCGIVGGIAGVNRKEKIHIK